jgi:hypothetical protein
MQNFSQRKERFPRKAGPRVLYFLNAPPWKMPDFADEMGD